MKKAIIILSLFGSLFIILSSFQISPAYAVAAFLLVGQIPGTTIILPPAVVPAIVALAGVFAMARLLRGSFRRHTDD